MLLLHVKPVFSCRLVTVCQSFRFISLLTLRALVAEQGLCNGRVSVCLSVPSIDSSSVVRLVCCWMGARAGDIHRRLRAQRTSYRSVPYLLHAGAGAQQQMRLASCWEPRNEAQHRLVWSFINLCIHVCTGNHMCNYAKHVEKKTNM